MGFMVYFPFAEASTAQGRADMLVSIAHSRTANPQAQPKVILKRVKQSLLVLAKLVLQGEAAEDAALRLLLSSRDQPPSFSPPNEATAFGGQINDLFTDGPSPVAPKGPQLSPAALYPANTPPKRFSMHMRRRSVDEPTSSTSSSPKPSPSSSPRSRFSFLSPPASHSPSHKPRLLLSPPVSQPLATPTKPLTEEEWDITDSEEQMGQVQGTQKGCYGEVLTPPFLDYSHCAQVISSLQTDFKDLQTARDSNHLNRRAKEKYDSREKLFFELVDRLPRLLVADTRNMARHTPCNKDSVQLLLVRLRQAFELADLLRDKWENVALQSYVAWRFPRNYFAVSKRSDCQCWVVDGVNNPSQSPARLALQDLQQLQSNSRSNLQQQQPSPPKLPTPASHLETELCLQIPASAPPASETTRPPSPRKLKRERSYKKAKLLKLTYPFSIGKGFRRGKAEAAAPSLDKEVPVLEGDFPKTLNPPTQHEKVTMFHTRPSMDIGRAVAALAPQQHTHMLHSRSHHGGGDLHTHTPMELARRDDKLRHEEKLVQAADSIMRCFHTPPGKTGLFISLKDLLLHWGPYASYLDAASPPVISFSELIKPLSQQLLERIKVHRLLPLSKVGSIFSPDYNPAAVDGYEAPEGKRELEIAVDDLTGDLDLIAEEVRTLLEAGSFSNAVKREICSVYHRPAIEALSMVPAEALNVTELLKLARCGRDYSAAMAGVGDNVYSVMVHNIGRPFNDLYISKCKTRAVPWIQNIITTEQSQPMLREQMRYGDAFLCTNAPQDLFSHLNRMLAHAAEHRGLEGRMLGEMYQMVLQIILFFTQAQSKFFLSAKVCLQPPPPTTAPTTAPSTPLKNRLFPCKTPATLSPAESPACLLLSPDVPELDRSRNFSVVTAHANKLSREVIKPWVTAPVASPADTPVKKKGRDQVDLFREFEETERKRRADRRMTYVDRKAEEEKAKEEKLAAQLVMRVQDSSQKDCRLEYEYWVAQANNTTLYKQYLSTMQEEFEKASKEQLQSEREERGHQAAQALEEYLLEVEDRFDMCEEEFLSLGRLAIKRLTAQLMAVTCVTGLSEVGTTDWLCMQNQENMAEIKSAPPPTAKVIQALLNALDPFYELLVHRLAKHQEEFVEATVAVLTSHYLHSVVQHAPALASNRWTALRLIAALEADHAQLAEWYGDQSWQDVARGSVVSYELGRVALLCEMLTCEGAQLQHLLPKLGKRFNSSEEESAGPLATKAESNSSGPVAEKGELHLLRSPSARQVLHSVLAVRHNAYISENSFSPQIVFDKLAEKLPAVKKSKQEAGSLHLQNPLLLTVERATGLAAADANGFSDPFCRIYLHSVDTIPRAGSRRFGAPFLRFSTCVKPRTLNPVWNFTIRVRPADLAMLHTIRFVIYDRDIVEFGRKDCLGQAVITMAQCRQQTVLQNTLHNNNRSNSVVSSRHTQKEDEEKTPKDEEEEDEETEAGADMDLSKAVKCLLRLDLKPKNETKKQARAKGVHRISVQGLSEMIPLSSELQVTGSLTVKLQTIEKGGEEDKEFLRQEANRVSNGYADATGLSLARAYTSAFADYTVNKGKAGIQALTSVPAYLPAFPSLNRLTTKLGYTTTGQAEANTASGASEGPKSAGLSSAFSLTPWLLRSTPAAVSAGVRRRE
eukprot:g60877.t1